MNVLITGGTGFLGAYIARELLEHGHRPVLYDLAPITENLRLAWGGEPPPIKIERGDILDPFPLVEIVRNHDIEAVIHLAYVLSGAAAENPTRALQVNIVGTNNMFELGRRMRLRKLLWASSAATHKAYEVTGDMVDDDSGPRPNTVYGYCKLMNEHMAQHYFERFHVDSVAFRPGFLTGIGKPTGLTSELIRQLLVNPAMGRRAVVPYPNDRLGWHDVTEVASIFRRALEFPGVPKRRAYNLKPAQTTVGEAIDIVRRLAPEADIEPGSGANWGEGKNYGPGYGGRLREDMGFQTESTAEQIFTRVIQQVRKTRSEIERIFPDA